MDNIFQKFSNSNSPNNQSGETKGLFIDSKGTFKEIQQIGEGLDLIYGKTEKTEEKMKSLSKTIEELSATSVKFATSMSSAFRDSGNLINPEDIESVTQQMSHLIEKTQTIKKLHEEIIQKSQSVTDPFDVENAKKNYDEMNGKLVEYAKGLHEALNSVQNFKKEVKETEVFQGFQDQISNVGDIFSRVIQSFSNGFKDLPEDFKKGLLEINELARIIEMNTQIAGNSAADAAKKVNQLVDAASPKDGIYLKAISDSIREVYNVTGDSTNNIESLLEKLTKLNGQEPLRLIESFKEVNKTAQNVQQKVEEGFYNNANEKALSDKVNFIKQVDDLQRQIMDIIQKNASSLSTTDSVSLFGFATTLSKQLEDSVKVAKSFREISQVYGNIPEVMNRNDILMTGVNNMLQTPVDEYGTQSHYVSTEFNHLQKNRHRSIDRASYLEQGAGLLSLGQLDGKKVPFDAKKMTEFAREAQEIQNRSYTIQDAINKAVKSGDKEQVASLFPQMTKLQHEANLKTKDITNLINLSPEKLKKLPSDVKEVVDRVLDYVKNIKMSNDNLISIGISTDNPQIQSEIEKLREFRSEITQTEKELNGTNKDLFDKIGDFMNPVRKGFNFVKSGAGIMGIGGVLSGAGIVRGTFDASRSQGSLEAQMALAEYSSGLRDGELARNSRFDNIFEDGLRINRSTNGMVGIEDYAKTYTNYARNIQGRYGEANDPRAMGAFAETSVLLQKGYGASESSISNNINFFYKELKMSASEVNAELFKMGQVSEQLNIPFEKYLTQVTNLATQFKNIGIDGRVASDVISGLMQGGMSNDMAVQYAGSLGKSLTSMNPGVLAYGGVMSGAYKNFDQAVGDMQYGMWNADGSINQDIIKKQAQTMNFMINQGESAFGGNKMATGMWLQGMLGMDAKETGITMSKIANGEDMSKILSSFYEKKDGFDNKNSPESQVEKGQKELAERISTASNNLSGIDKTMNALINQEHGLAHALENSIRSATDFSKAIYSIPVDKLKDSIIDNTKAIWALIAVMAAGPAGMAWAGRKAIAGAKSLKKGASGLFGRGKGPGGGGFGGGAGALEELEEEVLSKTSRTPGQIKRTVLGNAGKMATEAEAKAAGGFLSKSLTKIPKVGLPGLALSLGLGAGIELFGDKIFGGDSTPDKDANSLLKMTGNAADIFDTSGYKIGADSLDPSAKWKRTALNTVGHAAVIGGFSAFGMPIVGTAVDMGLEALGAYRGLDKLAGLDDASVMKNYIKSNQQYSSSAKEYSDYMYGFQGQDVDQGFSLMAGKALSEHKDILNGRSEQDRMKFATEYAKSIAGGASGAEATIKASRAINTEKLEGLSKQQVSATLDTLAEQKSSGLDINKIYKEEIPKSREATEKGLKDLSNATGIKLDELKEIFKKYGLSANEVLAALKQNGTMKDIEKSAAQKENDSNVSKFIDKHFDDKDKGTATDIYASNSELLSKVGYSEKEQEAWVKAAVDAQNQGYNPVWQKQLGNQAVAAMRSGGNDLKQIVDMYKDSNRHWVSGIRGGAGHYDYNIMKFDDNTKSKLLGGLTKRMAGDAGVDTGEMSKTLENMIQGLSGDDVDAFYSYLNSNVDKEEYNTGRGGKGKRAIKDSDGNYVFSSSPVSDVRNRQLSEAEKLNQTMEAAKKDLEKIAENTTDGGNGGVGGGITNQGLSDVRGKSGLSEDQLNKQLGGVLSGRGKDFLNAEAATGISAAFLAAVAMHETGNGTSSAAKNRNNVGGMMGSGGLMTFNSIEEGISAMANNLKSGYTDKGLTSVGQIQQKYAPIGAGNDPNNLNSDWTNGVSRFFGGLTGTSVAAIPPAPIQSNSNPSSDSNNDPYSGYNPEAGAPIDIGIGANDPFAGYGDTYSKSKYVSNLYGRGFTTLEQGMWNTQSLSEAMGEGARKNEHKLSIDVNIDKALKDPEVIKELKQAIESIFAKHGTELKADVAEALITSRFGGQ